MEAFYPALTQNSLRTRQDAATAFLALCRPLRPFYSEGKSLLYLGNTSAHYGEKSARMEGCARVLWGLGPLFSTDNADLDATLRAEIDDWASLYREGLVHGTDPTNPGYWGDIYDYDQKMVETAALSVALALAPQVLWAPLTESQRKNIYVWLNGMNTHKIHPNNWRFFRILTNMTFARLGLPVNAERLEDDFHVVNHCYTGDGWYFDGNPGQLDYYIPFAMHFYSLVWAALSPLDQDGLRDTLKTRSATFASDFIQWFADDGAEIPFGRSLTYRFAHSAFFSALALAGVESPTIPWGAVRHTVLQNLRHWFQCPILDRAGMLTIGYQYPNLVMSEEYNAPGSPYWAFKAFLFLALPATHPFWQGKETTVPHPAQILQEKPRMFVCHDVQGRDDHLTIYPAGQHCMNHGGVSEKYEKFVYSNRFGFSVGRGTALNDGAFDNTLAASLPGLDHYRMRYGVEEYRLTTDFIYTRYTLLPGLSVQSWVVPCGGSWHLRVHRLVATQTMQVADGGFSLPVEAPFTYPVGREDGKQIPGKEEILPGGIGAFLPWGAAAACRLAGVASTGKMICTFPNTNLMAPLCAVPTLIATLQPGAHWMVNAFWGTTSKNARSQFNTLPTVTIEGNCVTLFLTDKRTIAIEATD